MFDTTLPVVTRLMCDHYMGTSSKDEMYSFNINLTYNFRRNCTILLNHVIACTYYEINIYVQLNMYVHFNITLLIYKSTICTSSTYHVWRQN